LLGTKLDLQPHQLSLSSSKQLVMINDASCNLGVFRYGEVIVGLEKYTPAHGLHYAAFVGSDIVVSDERGVFAVLAVEYEQWQVFNHPTYSKPISLRIGDAISAGHSRSHCHYHITEKGAIYHLELLAKEQFELLRKIEEDHLKRQQQRGEFNYQQWRGRPRLDRLIDGEYVDLHLGEVQGAFREQAGEESWKELMAVWRR
jgi:hypothetical protein